MQAEDERLTDVEIRIAFMERTLETLDGLVREALDGLHLLRGEMVGLRREVDVAAARGTLEEEVPPHHGRG